MKSKVAARSPQSPWTWVPTLYYFQALPFFLLTSAAIVLFKLFGVSNSDLSLATSLFYLPWVIKPIAGPLVQRRGALKTWMWVTQVLMGVLIFLGGFATGLPAFLQIISVLFLMTALLGMTHDIAAEGWYMTGLTLKEQPFFVGVRATFFRLGWLTTQGGLVAWVGHLIQTGHSKEEAWRWGLMASGVLFAAFGVLHFFTLPKREQAKVPASVSNFRIFKDFFLKKDIGVILGFLLLYRLGEAQIHKMAMPFFLDPSEKGGLSLDPKTVGLLYGSLGPLFLSLGGLLGGWLVSRDGLKKWIVPMSLGLNIPHVFYTYLAFAKPTNAFLIGFLVNFEQFFYGVGFTAFLLFMIEASRGPYSTASYAVGTGLMAFGMMIPGAWSGALQQWMGYPVFFTWILLCSVPSVYVSIRAKKLVSY
ncbi:MAG: MFS transporter [Candidatus Melainabacteria bacterium]|nr:MFS transporter [Candidatus Melainabacteria bacterium]